MLRGAGNDTYVVDSTGDAVTENASQGTDTIQTTLSTFSLVPITNVENLTFIGMGNFTGTGNALGNVISGGAGNDHITGLVGNDIGLGGNGNDTFVATSGDGADFYADGGGADTLDMSAITVASTINLSSGSASSSQTGSDFLSSIERAIGGSGNDQITGSSAANVLQGGGGNDTINAGGGAEPRALPRAPQRGAVPHAPLRSRIRSGPISQPLRRTLPSDGQWIHSLPPPLIEEPYIICGCRTAPEWSRVEA
jgi:Ca2+-binding RTX toxin-like protein